VSSLLKALLLAALLAAANGCAGTDRKVECRGPSTPIGSAKQDRANG